jgi:hypothetical protein
MLELVLEGWAARPVPPFLTQNLLMQIPSHYANSEAGITILTFSGSREIDYGYSHTTPAGEI